jgi:hypothetical protein
MHLLPPQVELDPGLLVLTFVVLGFAWLVAWLPKARGARTAPKGRHVRG